MQRSEPTGARGGVCESARTPGGSTVLEMACPRPEKSAITASSKTKRMEHDRKYLRIPSMTESTTISYAEDGSEHFSRSQLRYCAAAPVGHGALEVLTDALGTWPAKLSDRVPSFRTIALASDGPICHLRDSLERNLGAELPKARKGLRRGNAKVACRQVALNALEIGMVEEVVELEPELQIEPLR